MSVRLAVALLMATLLAGMSTAADAPPTGRFVVRGKAALRALTGRAVFDVQPGAALVLGAADFSRATTAESAATLQWVDAFERAGRKWRMHGESIAEPRVRIRATVVAKGRSLRGRLSGGGLRHAIQFKATRSTCGDRFVDVGSGEQCEATADCRGNGARCSGCVCTSGDPDFGVDGTATIDALDAGATIADMAVRPDGTIVAAGGTSELLLVQILPDGRVDPTFGTNGVVHTGIDRHDAASHDGRGDVIRVVVQEDGRIVLSNAFTIARFTVDGTRDDGFGYFGIVFFPFRGVISRFADAGGRIPIEIGGAISRLLPDGSPDPTVPLAGMVPSPNVGAPFSYFFDDATFRFAYAGDFDAEGRFAAAHDFTLGPYPVVDQCLTRFFPDASVDPSFQGGYPDHPDLTPPPNCVTGGTPALGAQGVNGQATIFVLPSGRIFARTSASSRFGSSWALLMLSEDGTQQTTLTACKASVLEDGICTAPRVVAGGVDGTVAAIADRTRLFHQGPSVTSVVQRLHADGTLDADFGGGGSVDLPGTSAIVVQPDGGIVAASTPSDDTKPRLTRFAPR